MVPAEAAAEGGGGEEEGEAGRFCDPLMFLGLAELGLGCECRGFGLVHAEDSFTSGHSGGGWGGGKMRRLRWSNEP